MVNVGKAKQFVILCLDALEERRCIGTLAKSRGVKYEKVLSLGMDLWGRLRELEVDGVEEI